MLTRRRNLKMARSAHAYVRGSTEQFYAWLDSGAGRAVPQGPAVWVCGDCHTGNLGFIGLKSVSAVYAENTSGSDEVVQGSLQKARAEISELAAV